MALWLLQTLHKYTSVPIDQLNFFICQILSIVFGFLLRAYCPPRNTNTFKRHIIEISVGFTLIYLCYGSQVSHLLYQAIPSYLMMVLLPPHLAQYGVLLFTMAYLSGAHITRMLSTDLRNSVVDVTAPLMVQTQKLSSIAFNLYDGDILKRGQKTARSIHELHAISERPRLLHLLSYLLCYQNSMVGPFVFFSDYLCFIEGREEDQVTTEEDRDLFIKHKEDIRTPKRVLKNQLLCALFHTSLLVYATGRYNPQYFISEEFQRLGIFRKYFWLTLGCFYFRQRFYCAWAISATTMLAAGFGFSGFKPGTAEPEYRNAINIRFFDIELGTNTKGMFDGWNIGTTRWLRECVYDRVPKQFSVVAVFFVSAFWHGFYPVYYLCFLTAALLTSTGRLCRRRLRPFFHRKLLEPLHVQYTNPPLSDVLSQLSGRRLLTVEQWECTQVLGKFLLSGACCTTDYLLLAALPDSEYHT
uniref:Lysophospholipid acyltransferase 2 n=1 Tax=Schistocephalus solidus TaxID=70667 RepID=A0A0X3PLF5_SCHSO